MSGFQDIKRASRRMGIKSTSAGPWGKGKFEKGYTDGVGLCGHYDVELDRFNNCRDEDCRRDRLIKALHTGEAMKLPNGTLLWTPGTIIRKMP